MSTTFGYLKSKLNGVIDILPPSLMGDFINNALEDIYSEQSWGFLMKEDYMRTPALIDQGTVNVTKFLNTVTFNSTASALLAALTVNDLPLIGRQFRVQSATQLTGKSFTYEITNFDDSVPTAIVLTIDPPYLDISNTAAKFQILQIFYNPPEITYNDEIVFDFRSWKFFLDLKAIRRLNLDTTLEVVNNYDPIRNRYALGEPRHVIAHPPLNDNNFPRFELYPAPRFERIYKVIYQRKGLELIDDDQTIPNLISRELVLERAKYRLYEYALGNSQKYPELKGSAGRFQNLMALTVNPNNEMSYPSLLEKLKAEDEKAYPKAYLGDYMRINYWDSCFNEGMFQNEFGAGDGFLVNSTFSAEINF